jgi:hypothetical protein
MQTILTKVHQRAAADGIDTQTLRGQAWLLNKIQSLRVTARDRMTLIQDREAQRNRAMLGRLYFFYYDAKTKDLLPYWDRFPLVIPIEQYSDGFLGLNLHYIYPKDRLILLRQLSAFEISSKRDERKRLMLTYPLLQSMGQSYRATPCIKRYLASHVQSRCIEIPAKEWEIAATLPAHEFRSSAGSISSRTVWSESKGKY